MKTIDGHTTMKLSPACADTLIQVLTEWRNVRTPLDGPDGYIERRYASHSEAWRGVKRLGLVIRLKHVEAALAQLGAEVADPTT